MEAPWLGTEVGIGVCLWEGISVSAEGGVGVGVGRVLCHRQ